MQKIQDILKEKRHVTTSIRFLRISAIWKLRSLTYPLLHFRDSMEADTVRRALPVFQLKPVFTKEGEHTDSFLKQ